MGLGWIPARRLMIGALTVAVAAAGPPSSASLEQDGYLGGTLDAEASLLEPAIDIARRTRSVPLDDDMSCPAHRLRVRWSLPGGYLHGAHIEPLGPPPTALTPFVNGVVVCAGSTFAYMGFEAVRSHTGWVLHPTPDVDTEEDEGAHGAEPPPPEHTAEIPAKASAASPTPPGLIEPYAAHDPQTGCSPAAKPGVVGFRDLLLATYPISRDLGISRACSIGGPSEHKEGRAFDWGVRTNRTTERASADALLRWLFATDEDGNRHANARRLGIMYIVWDHKIWGAYHADAGWRPYRGSSPHTDHIHFSFTWPGAGAATSFWTRDGATLPGTSTVHAASGRVDTLTAARITARTTARTPAGPPRVPPRRRR